MATIQSAYFKGNARSNIPVPNKAGVVCEVIVSHTFTETVASTDVLELFALAGGNRILSVDITSENIGAINLGIGFMSGTPGDVESVRTNGTEIFAAQAANSAAAMTLAAVVALTTSDSPRSIGVVPASNITAASNKKLHMRVRYAAA